MTIYGIPRNSSQLDTYYDHIKFPGAVPRTFVGASLVSLPLYLVRNFIDDPVKLQIFGEYVFILKTHLTRTQLDQLLE